MGVDYFTCAGCEDAFDEYNEGCNSCSECRNHYCGNCVSTYTTRFKSLKYEGEVDYVCDECNNYGTPPTCNDEKLLKFVLEKYHVTEEQMIEEWESTQPIRNRPCGKCETTECNHSYDQTLSSSAPDYADRHSYEDDDGNKILGYCCKCAHVGENWYCKECLQSKAKKLKK